MKPRLTDKHIYEIMNATKNEESEKKKMIFNALLNDLIYYKSFFDEIQKGEWKVNEQTDHN